MISRLAYRINQTLERYFPEQRLFLKSDSETRFIRLRPVTQAVAVVVGGLALAWTILATAILMFDSISAGSSRDQVQRQQSLYEERLNSLSVDRDLRVEEAVRAQERFNLALQQVASMQARLLASEDRRRELETGIDVIQNTLRRTIEERDEARVELNQAQVASAPGSGRTEAGRAQDQIATLEFLASSLDGTAKDRDRMQGVADGAAERVEKIAKEKQELELRNAAIFSQLEEALTVSVEPLEKMFLDAGMNPEDLLNSVRKGYSGQGGPLSPLLSNILLTDLDRELERRGHRFCRYADDCNIYVKSEMAGLHAMEATTEYLEKKLKLRVNRDKSAVARPWQRKCLGYSVTWHKQARLKIAEGSVKRLKDKETAKRVASQADSVSTLCV